MGPVCESTDLRRMLAPYRRCDLRKSIWQLASTLMLFMLVFALMWVYVNIAIWVTLLLAVPAAGLIVRLFVIHHDCGHGSFFRSRRANHIVGFVLGAMTLTPYMSWRWTHAQHHAASGDLDRRGYGDIPTLTVREYLRKGWWGRLMYRLYRHPLVLFGLSPAVLFLFIQRLTYDLPRENRAARASVHWTNVVIAVYAAVLCWFVGVGPFLLVHLPIMCIAGSAGVWLFYVQHQYEDAYWRRGEEWSIADAALRGSTFYDLPRVLQWFTANIGFHHIHHLDSRIPNYNLQACYEENPSLQVVKRLTLRESLRCIFVKMWDEQEGKMVGFPRRSQRKAFLAAMARFDPRASADA